ncbi:single-stranded DNA-binding protein [Haloimpatiens massiliensis]|uniref:single-stranded DNA-binding protein n=1 Tax=Haloimpatiens massiliensis TaxID=1658110 RepID=UPI000C8273AF|nr:single-stranded DNA-binding protein [Haloimpatiens massiliensis]
MNKVTLIGRLTKDTELIDLNESDRKGLGFTLAVDRRRKNINGEREADFIPVIYFTKHYDSLVKYLLKGRLIAVSGRISIYSKDQQDGTRRYYTSVVADEIKFLESKKESAV